MATPEPLPDLPYDALHTGQRFKDSLLTLTPEMVRAYGRAVHNDALLEQAGRAMGTAIDDPSLVVIFGITRRVLGQDGNPPPGGILASQDFTVNRLLRLGESVRTRTSIEDKYEKRGRRYVHLRCDVEDAAGAPIGRVDSHVIWAR